jgi:protein TonB
MAKINLYSHAWCEVVFFGKNKEYGAYDLRKQSGKRHLIAFVIVLFVCVLSLLLPTIINKLVPAKTAEHMVDVTTLANLLLEENKPKEEVIHEQAPPPPPLKSTIKFTIPVVKKDEEVNEEDEVKTQEQLNESNLTISMKDVQGTDEENGLDVADLEKHEEITESSSPDKPYLFVEQKPEFPGGEAELRKFLSDNVVYPVIAQENGVKGTVFVAFVVGPDGKISRIKVLRGFDKTCEDEAIRVIKAMPPWKPGKQNGVAVYVQYTVPIKFDLR